MAGFKFTHRTIAAAVCPPSRKDALFFDTETRGFGVRVTAGGSKLFLAQFVADGGKRRMPLGAFGTVTVEQARNAAKSILGQAAHGADPAAERKERVALARQKKTDGAYTFAAMVAAWAAAREGDRRPSYLREAVSCLTRNLPKWQTRPATEITIADAVRALDGIKASKGVVAANRTLAYGRAAFGWAVKRQALAINPMRGLERPGREAARERVLRPDELGAIWRACDTLSPAMAGFVRVLMLTLGRRDEVASMRWKELDNAADPTVWTLPSERSKNGRAHVVHLAEPVRAIMRSMPAIKGNPFVFAARDDKPLSAFSHAKDEIQAALEKAGTPLPDWRFHDFRRAGVTALANGGVAPHVADKLLNHITGTIQGVAAVYQRAEFLTERSNALEAWARLVLAAAEGIVLAGNVVKLARVG
jgi:integrase